MESAAAQFFSRRRLLRSIAAITATSLIAPSALRAADARSELDIRVAKDGWTDASADDIEKVLVSAASMLWPHFADRKLDPIEVSFNTDGPIVLFRRGKKGQHQVHLDVKGTYWAQFAFQFAHELCHILCGYREGPEENKWFEESLCEMASLFAVRGMAKQWERKPPYANWKSFAPKLAEYAEKRRKDGALPEGMTLAAWYRENAASLRGDPTQREKNLTVAAALLPLVEESPGSWEAVTYLNRAPIEKDLSFAKYLARWREQSPKRHHAFIENMAEKFGVSP